MAFKYLISLFICTCTSMLSAQIEANSFVKKGNIWTEVIDSSNTSPTRYSVDNLVYKLGTVLTYSVEMRDKNQNPIACGFRYDENVDRSDAGHFIEPSQKDSNTVEYISFNVPLDPTKMEMSGFWAYQQTDVCIDYRNAQKNILGTRLDSTHWNPRFRGKFISDGELTGVIDNKKNIWLHPPRRRCFKINELNPFPFVQLPLVEGNKWIYNITAGGEWGDKRWASWSNLMDVKSNYEVKEKTKRTTKMGVLDCYRVECMGTCSLGTTHLTFYFNPEFGFIYMEFTNIDNSTTILELIEKTN